MKRDNEQKPLVVMVPDFVYWEGTFHLSVLLCELPPRENVTEGSEQS